MSHHSDASRHPANKPFLYGNHDAYPHVKTPHGIFQDHQTLSISDLPMESAIPPTTSLSSRAFSGSNFIDFEFDCYNGFRYACEVCIFNGCCLVDRF